MSDNPAAQATQPLVTRIVSSYLKKTMLLRQTFRPLSTLSTNHCCPSAKLPIRYLRLLLSQSDNPFAPHTSCVSNAEREG
jgi:hypothetical protein